ncbi:MAG: GNAT family N-acetyltransferase [Pseudomonadota bacterium]
MIQNLNWKSGEQPSDTALAELRGKAFAFTSMAPRAADILRAGAAPYDGAILSAYAAADLAGYVALWPTQLVHRAGEAPLALLGPLMVDPRYQGIGLGRSLMRRILSFADTAGLPPILLVGDQSYYEQFGFENAVSRNWQMPGLAAPERVLTRSLGPLPQAGAVTAQPLAAFAPPCNQQTAA